MSPKGRRFGSGKSPSYQQQECPPFENREGWGNRFVMAHGKHKAEPVRQEIQTSISRSADSFTLASHAFAHGTITRQRWACQPDHPNRSSDSRFLLITPKEFDIDYRKQVAESRPLPGEQPLATVTMQGTTAESIRKGFRSDHIFFPAMSALILVTVFVGFARTYYLAGMVRAHLPSPIIHIHAVVFSLWVLLLVTQTSLVAAHRIDAHRKLGLVGFGLACLMPVLGVLGATNSLSRNFAPPGFPLGAQTFYIIPMSSMLLFSILAFFAYRERRNSAVHKRLILIATFAIMDAPTGRPPLSVITGHPPSKSRAAAGPSINSTARNETLSRVWIISAHATTRQAWAGS